MNHPTVAERAASGRAARKTAPRTAHAEWEVPRDRADPVAVLREQAATRVAELVPIRHGRMAESVFAYLRGAAAGMAADLAGTPISGISVQACGDAHLLNFGLYASPERSLLFDVNDFDETLAGPWEWDVKRLAASVVVAARSNEWDDAVGRSAALAAATAYRRAMRDFAQRGDLDVWYARASAEDLRPLLTESSQRKRAKRVVKAARRRDNLQAFEKLTVRLGDTRRIVDDPPLVEHPPDEDVLPSTLDLFHAYRGTLQEDRQRLLDRFQPIDVARKVVGVGSVGTRCYIVLLIGRDLGDPLLLQVKQAEASVLEKHLRGRHPRQHGKRVVTGQRLMQSASDIFLGWLTAEDGLHYYWRQLRDMKGSVDIARLRPAELQRYAELCGWTLARAHARTGDRVAIAAYLGSGDVFDRAIADFALAYADQSERDHQALVQAIADGRVEASP
ncbi:DUF2252 domain-containing protein [Amycolatopsis sp. NPDC058986]|uniref:DUF2252 domain-containing protein n=1 Tax=unclassified Amycolatopsis TaxID=2618356 RepID=UPI00366D7D9F